MRYRVDYEVVGHTINFRASFDGPRGPSSHEGQFDFDPARVGAEAAVDGVHAEPHRQGRLGRRALGLIASAYFQRQVQITSIALSAPAWARTVMRCATR